MAYSCVLYHTSGKYIFPGFDGTEFKLVQFDIYSKAYQIFINVYERFHIIVQQIRKVEKNVCDHN